MIITEPLPAPSPEDRVLSGGQHVGTMPILHGLPDPEACGVRWGHHSCDRMPEHAPPCRCSCDSSLLSLPVQR